MAALRVVCLACERPVHPHPRLVDIGTASALGHRYDGGRLVRPEPTPTPPSREPIHDEHKRAVWAAAQRRCRERRRVTA